MLRVKVRLIPGHFCLDGQKTIDEWIIESIGLHNLSSAFKKMIKNMIFIGFQLVNSTEIIQSDSGLQGWIRSFDFANAKATPDTAEMIGQKAVTAFFSSFFDPFGFWESAVQVSHAARQWAFFAGLAITVLWNLLLMIFTVFVVFRIGFAVAYCLRKSVRLCCCWVTRENTAGFARLCCFCCRKKPKSEEVQLV